MTIAVGFLSAFGLTTVESYMADGEMKLEDSLGFGAFTRCPYCSGAIGHRHYLRADGHLS